MSGRTIIIGEVCGGGTECKTLQCLSTMKSRGLMEKRRSPALVSKLHLFVIGMIMNGC